MNHVLVVDDAEVDRALAGGLLKAAGHVVEFASNGVEALEHMDARLPLAVVTDLRMPEMDGMLLIRSIRRRFPHVPVVVMTAHHGSEDVGLNALMCGAADYVPKTRLASDLAQSVASVLAVRTPNRPHQMLNQCLRRQEFYYALDNDMLFVAPLVRQFQDVTMELDLLDEGACVRMGRALVEALRNAIFHGNLELPFDQLRTAGQTPEQALEVVTQRRGMEPYRDRRVHVEAVFQPGEARFRVRDEGPGFDVARVPEYTSDPANLGEHEGRGLALIYLFADLVELTPPGNEITLVWRGRHA